MRTTAVLSAVLAGSAAAQAAFIATEPSTNTTAVNAVPPPLSTGNSNYPPYPHGNATVVIPSGSAPYPTASGSPIPSSYSTGSYTTGSGLPPVPTSSRTGAPTAVPTAGATINAQNSFLAMGIAVVVAALTL